MDSIAALENTLRRYYNDRELRELVPAAKTGRQSGVAAALDTLRATNLALAYFRHRRLPTSRVNSPVRIGSKYLHLYGALQAVYMQQDAILDLWALLVDQRPSTKDLIGWSELRDWRDTLTHPQRHNVTISEMQMGSMALVVWLHGRGRRLAKQRLVDLRELLPAYAENAVVLLRRLDLRLRAKWK